MADQYTVTVEGLDDCLKILTKAGAQLHDLDVSQVKLANAQLKSAAKDLASRFGTEVVAPLVSGYGGGIGPAMAETIRPKADRMPIVRVGAVNPKLSGWNTRPKNPRRRNVTPGLWKGSLAWGAEFGPYPGATHNPYGRRRASGGHAIGPRTTQLEADLVPLYIPLVVAAMETAGWPVDRQAV
jgi:hypothetical protein